jgi:membrane protease subunit (stomatin/prohibitin family)
MRVLEFLDNSGEIIVTRVPQDGSADFYLGAERNQMKALQASLASGKSSDLAFGSQLVVQESQVAVFFRDGQALDSFGPGRHTLMTENLPVLRKLMGATFGGKTPFRAYVYFVATKTFTNLGWGTPTPVIFRDADLRMVSLRAHGSFAIRVTKVRTFLNTIVGTRGLETTYAIEQYLRSVIISRLNETIGKTIKSILDLPMHYSDIAMGVKQATAADFEQYGIQLVDLLVEAITPPPEVQEMINRATGVAAQDADKYGAIAAADALRDAARNPGAGGAGAGMGLGAGLGMGMAMARNVGDMMPGMTPQQRQPPAQPVPAGNAGMTAEEIEQRLVRLKGLLDKGLISEADFTQQKQRLLEML